MKRFIISSVLIVVLVIVSITCSTVLADGGSVPRDLCGTQDTILGVMRYEGIQKLNCGLSLNEKGDISYFEQILVSHSFSDDNEDEMFFLWLNENFESVPFENVDAIKDELKNKENMSFDIVSHDGDIVTIEILDQYFYDFVFRKPIDSTDEITTAFYKDNLNLAVLDLGEIGYLWNGSYETVQDTLTVNFVDIDWNNDIWVERKIAINLEDDFERIKTTVFSDEFKMKYVDQLRWDIYTRERLNVERENMLASGIYNENDVEYILEKFDLKDEIAGDWMKISMINGIELMFVFDDENHQLEIRQKIDQLDQSLGEIKMLYGKNNTLFTAETVVNLLHPDFYAFAAIEGMDVFDHQIIRQADGRITFSTMFDYNADFSSWTMSDEQQQEDYNEWLITQPEDEHYLFYIDWINTVNTKLVLNSVVIDNKAQFENIMDQNFNETLFALGDVADFSERGEELVQILSFVDLEKYSYLKSEKIFNFGDKFDAVKDYMLSDSYYDALKTLYVSNYHFVDPSEDNSMFYLYNSTAPVLLFGINGVPIEVYFIDERQQISVVQHGFDPDVNLVDFIEPVKTIEHLGFDCVGGSPSMILSSEPIEMNMKYEIFDVAGSIEFLSGSASDEVVFNRYGTFSFEYDPQTKNIIFVLGNEVGQTSDLVSFIVYEDWSYSPVAGAGISNLNEAFISNFGEEAYEGVPYLIDSFRNLFVSEFDLTFEEFVRLPMLQYNEIVFY